MTQPVDVDLNLGGDYTQGVQQATQVTEGLAGALSAVQAPARSVQAALNAATPSKVHIAAWGGFVAAAGYFQQQTSGIRATATAAGQSLRTLTGDVQGLARQFPIGTAGAVALVQAVQGLGVQESRVRPLAQTFQRIAAATNSFGPDVAQGFGQLNRAMASLDPQRVSRFGDVLTTLSAKTGASASGMISFSHAISPVAQQAGIGESAVLGISAAFVKLGDDGGAAATAVNKILGDLNRSVREGSNDMAAYAQITGMTVNQFKALYQANPAQALSAVTTAIGHAGPRGQMELENLGLEGTRTQRALLQLSQSGGLNSIISQATGAYGNGSTQQAAAAAMNGLNSSLTELRSTAGQTADALGGPFLHVLTRITDVAKIALAPVNAALGSGVGQHAIAGAGALGLAALGARRVLMPMSTAALGFQAATSGPVRSLFGGYAMGRTGGQIPNALEMRSGRYGQEAIAMQAYGAPYGRGFMQGVNRRAMGIGNIAGEFRSDMAGQPWAPGAGGGGGSFLRRAGRAGIAGSTMAYEGWARAFADPFHQSTRNPADRESLLTPSAGGMFNQANVVRQQAGMRAALGYLEREGTRGGAAMARFTSATLGATRAVTTFTGRAAEAGVGMMGTAGKGALGLVGGGFGAALLGGYGAYSIYRGEQAQTKAGQDRISNLEMFGTLNRYRDAIGQAGEATVTLADQMDQAAAAIAKTVTTLPQAKTVSAADIAANPPDDKKVSHTYTGSARAVAAQITSENVNGLNPQDLQAIKQDLLRAGRRPQDVNDILGMVDTSPGGRASTQTVQGIVSGAATAASAHHQSLLHRARGASLPGEKGTWAKIGSSVTPEIGKSASDTLDLLQGSIMQQYASLTDNYTQAYAVQTNIRSANDALQQALKSGNPDLVASVAQRVGATVTGNKKFRVSAAQVAASGGDITKLVGNQAVYGQSMADWQRQGVTTTGQGVAATRVAGGDVTALQSAGAQAFTPFFGGDRPGGATGRAYDAIKAFEAQPANAKLQTAAVQQFVSAAQNAGQSLASIATNANRAIGTSSGAQNTLMQGAYGEAQFQLQRNLIGSNRATQFAQQSAFYGGVATSPAEGPDAAKNIADARQNLLELQNQETSFYQQRVMAQYQYQIQSERAQEDYHRQMSRSEEDFLVGRQRAYRDFNINLQRQQQDAAAQMYNPFQRIQTVPTWDAANLIGNRGEQLTALRQQMANISKLRHLGLTQQTIDQLHLYDPANAQQVTELVADLQSNQSEVGQLNKQSRQIQGASSALLSQSPDSRRQRQDFQRSLRDQQTDFDRQQRRARQDFATAMSRMAQDMHTQDLEITNDMTALTADMNKILHGQSIDLSHQVTSSLKDTLATVKHYAPMIHSGLSGATGTTSGGSGPTGNVGSVNLRGSKSGGGVGNAPLGNAGDTRNPRTGQVTGGSGFTYVAPGTGSTKGTGHVSTMSSTDPNSAGADMRPSEEFMRAHPANAGYNQSIAKAMMPRWGSGAQWKAWQSLWQQESKWSQYADNGDSSAYGIAQLLGGNIPKYYWPMKDWRTNPASQIKGGIGYIKDTYGDPVRAEAHEQRFGWYAKGSIFTGPKVIGVGEGGPEAAIPLNAQGLDFMVRALKQYVSVGDAKMIGSGGLAYATHVVHQNYHYDQRLDMSGSTVKVEASDPSKMKKALEEKAHLDNLTASRSRR